jgi:uncharacterized protein
MRVAVWTMLLGVSLVSSAEAATFDCNKASTFVEKAICSDSRLTSMDDQLGRLYKDALAASSDSAALKAEQRAWLSSRDQCKDSDCVIKAYEDRIGVLTATSSPAKSRNFTGTYKAAVGEVLVQQTPDGRIKFAISAMWKMNVGEVSGDPLERGCGKLRRQGKRLQARIQVRDGKARRDTGWRLRHGPQRLSLWDLQTRERRSAEIRRLTKQQCREKSIQKNIPA